MRGSVHRCSESDAGIPAIPHYFQCGVGCSSVTLGVSDGGGRIRAGRERKIG